MARRNTPIGPPWLSIISTKLAIEVKNKRKDMTNEQIDELLAEIGRAPLITSEEEHVLLKAVKGSHEGSRNN